MKLRPTKAVYGGASLAHIEADAVQDLPAPEQSALLGKTVFIPFTLPRETVEAHLTDDRRSFAFAELDAVIEPSPERILPGCEYFTACGGCHYQHTGPDYQLRLKKEVLRGALDRAHLTPQSAAIPIEAVNGHPWNYRNRIRLQIAARDGAVQLCYRARGTRQSIAVTHCPIAAPLLNRAIAAISGLGAEASLLSHCDEVELFTNGEEDTLLVWLKGSGSHRSRGRRGSFEQALDRFAAALKAELPELAGAGLFHVDRKVEQEIAHWGQRSLRYKVGGNYYRVSIGSFFQINRFLLPQMVEAAISGRRGRRAWDLYAGVGLFAQALDFEEVIAVEQAPSSAADLKHNLRGKAHRAVRSATLDFLRGQRHIAAAARPELILLDPPRYGLGAEVCSLLLEIGAPELIYISCDPATLARDLEVLLRTGYRLARLQMLDLFPQTFHIETVAALTRSGS